MNAYYFFNPILPGQVFQGLPWEQQCEALSQNGIGRGGKRVDWVVALSHDALRHGPPVNRRTGTTEKINFSQPFACMV